ncbi:MAG: alpha-amylase family protein [Longimicrobiales bacterium]
MHDLWYKDAIIYCVDVDTYQDSDDDGCGDFRGLERRLDHLAYLGVNCLWLLPIHPTPDRDNGYDVTDYYAVDPRLGTLGDFAQFMRSARERGIRVLLDLVVNHTSDQHPWFRQARSDPDSRYRDWYVWSDTKPEDAASGVVFPGVQQEVWSYDRTAKSYFLHRFYEHQPDLNISNPRVREEILRIMGFWLELGVSGFRVDAAPFLIELKGTSGDGGTDPYEYLTEFRRFLSWHRGDAILLAEANVTADQLDDYLGDGDRLHMLFDFMLNQHLFLALARAEKTPLIQGFQRPPDLPTEAQWAQFLRNHDELDLGRLTERQREEAFAVFAPREDMRIYDRGVRRRLAPMLGNDADRLRMAYSLLLTLPGTPVIWYGDEIGMGDDLSLHERNPVRTPMQWSDEPNAGFSGAPADALPRPIIRRGEFGYRKVNVDAQTRDPDSLLGWMSQAIGVRRRAREFGWGRARLHETGHPAVLAHSCTHASRSVVAVHNLSAEPAEVALDLSDLCGSTVRDLLGPLESLPLEDGTLALELDGYGYRWFRLEGRT